MCGDPPSVPNAARLPSNGPLNTNKTVVYMCNFGYKLVGNGNLTCTITGDYVPNPPTCGKILLKLSRKHCDMEKKH